MTISDIAKMAGVSSAAVSRYLNGGPLSEQKRAVIQAVVEKTGYSPDTAAQTLRTGKVRQVGVIVPSISSQSVGQITSGIAAELGASRYLMLLADTELDGQMELEYLTALQRNHVAGIILLGYDSSPQLCKALKDCRVPVVVTGQRFADLPCVYNDDRSAARDLTRKMLEHGRKNIVYIGGSEQDAATGIARRQGVQGCTAGGRTERRWSAPRLLRRLFHGRRAPLHGRAAGTLPAVGRCGLRDRHRGLWRFASAARRRAQSRAGCRPCRHRRQLGRQGGGTRPDHHPLLSAAGRAGGCPDAAAKLGAHRSGRCTGTPDHAGLYADRARLTVKKEERMKQKLIFLDIDGTLLPPGEMLIPQSTVEALHKAHANGHKLFLCTGRNLRMTQPLLDYGFDGAVCSAGGYVFCGDKVLVDLPMEPQLAKDVRSAMERHGVECTLEARDATYGSLKMIERWSFTHRDAGNLNSEAARWRKAMEDGMTISPLADYKGEPLYKIVYIAEHSEDLDEAKQLYEDRFVFCESKLDGLDGGYVNGELINRKFDKGRGIKAVCDYLNVPLQDSIGFGDSDNDLQMTDVVGISVCMANGSASLKQRCDRIAPSVYEDGIAKEFAALGLI